MTYLLEIVFIHWLQISVWKTIPYEQGAEEEKQKLIAEVNNLMKVELPPIIQTVDCIDDLQNKTVYIITEFVETEGEHDLASVIKKVKSMNQAGWVA